VCNLFANIPEGAEYAIPVAKNGKIAIKEGDSWKTSKNMMKDPNKFMENLNAYKAIIDEMRIPASNFAGIQEIIA
jgi:hypothetical protein